jgi:hypothetical protein
VALVRFFGGGGNPGSIQAVTLENEAREGTRSLEQRGEESYPSALAAPIWGAATRLFRGHPRITGLLMWDARERSIQIAGRRGAKKFDEITARQAAFKGSRSRA